MSDQDAAEKVKSVWTAPARKFYDINFPTYEARRAAWDKLTDEEKWDASEHYYSETCKQEKVVRNMENVIRMIPVFHPGQFYGDPFQREKDWITAAIYIVNRLFDDKKRPD